METLLAKLVPFLAEGATHRHELDVGTNIHNSGKVCLIERTGEGKPKETLSLRMFEMLRTPTEADPELFDQEALEEGEGGGVEGDEIEEVGQQGGEVEGDAEEANLGGSLEGGGEKKDIAAGARGSLLVVEEDDGQIIKRCTVYPRVLHWSKVSVKIFPTGSGLKG